MGCDYDYAEACLPDRWTVLGVRLPAFTVGHLLLLERIESPFAGGGQPDESDLIKAVWICSGSYKTRAKQLWKPFHKQLFGVFWMLWMFRKAVALKFRKGLLAREVSKLNSAVSYGQRKPADGKIYHDPNAEKTYAPLVLILMRDLSRYSQEEILNMPVTRAMFEREGLLEKSGGASFPEPAEFYGGKAESK